MAARSLFYSVWRYSRIFLAEAVASSMMVCLPSLAEPPVSPLIPAITFICAMWIFLPISGGQINPIFSLVGVLTRRIRLVFLLLYWPAQVTGAVAGLALAYALRSPEASPLAIPCPREGLCPVQVMVIEAMLAFALTLVLVATLDEHRPEGWGQSNGLNCIIPIGAILYVNNTIAVSCDFHPLTNPQGYDVFL